MAEQWENLERALAACPETTFIGHAPGFWREISGDAALSPEVRPRTSVVAGGKVQALLRKFPNLMADLSAGSALTALSRNPEYAASFLDEFSDRLLFARDYYGQEFHHFLQSLELKSIAVENIYFRDAERLLGCG